MTSNPTAGEAGGPPPHHPLALLAVPEQQTPVAGSFLLDPRATEQWLETLPQANIGELARQLFNALVDFNRITMPVQNRARVIELFREPIAYICSNLEKHYRDAGLPLSPKADKVAALVRELHTELTLAYKIIIRQLLEPENARVDPKLLVVAIHRTLYYFERVLFNALLTYEQWPIAFWREAHSLYAYAEQNQLDQIPVRERDVRKAPSSTITQSYTGLLTLATGLPFRLRQAHIRQFWSLLPEWRNQVRLVREHEQGEVGIWQLDFLQDQPPVHISLAQPGSARTTRLLDTRRLIKKLRTEYEGEDRGAETPFEGDHIPKPVLKQLAHAWGKARRRRFARTQLRFQLHIVVGLQATHDLMAPNLEEQESEQASQPSQPRPSRARQLQGSLGGLGLAPIGDAPSPPRRNFAGLRDSSSASGDGLEAEEIWSERGKTRKRPETFVVHTNNESAGGYCIPWPNNSPAKLRIGELVGIRSASNVNQFGVALVRWIRNTLAHEMEVGLQLLSSTSRYARLWTIDGKGRKTGKPIDILTIPTSEKKVLEVLSTRQDLDRGKQYCLASDQPDLAVKITDLAEWSGAIARYTVKLAPLPKTEQKDHPGSNFDGIWTNL